MVWPLVASLTSLPPPYLTPLQLHLVLTAHSAHCHPGQSPCPLSSHLISFQEVCLTQQQAHLASHVPMYSLSCAQHCCLPAYHVMSSFTVFVICEQSKDRSVGSRIAKRGWLAPQHLGPWGQGSGLVRTRAEMCRHKGERVTVTGFAQEKYSKL